MFTKTIKTIITKGSTDSLNESMGKLFEKFNDVFDKADEAVVDESSITSCQNDGEVSITNNHGHIVIVGKVASLNVNGVSFEIEKSE